MTLTRQEAIVLAKEVRAGKARSYVSAAHAFAEFILLSWDEEAERRAAVCDALTLRGPPEPTIPLPFADPSPPITIHPPLESDELDDLDDVARSILAPAPLPSRTEPSTGVRVMLPTTVAGPRLRILPDEHECDAHHVRHCEICHPNGGAA